jgi:glycine oxidase
LNSYLIVGGGALGLASAQALRLQGAEVTVLERIATGQESSWAGGGILSPLCPWDYPEEVTQLALRGAAKFGAWATALHQATGIDPEYSVCGMRVLPPVDLDLAQRWCESHQVPVTIDGDSLFLPAVAQARNPRLMQALRANVAQLGVKIIEHCEVQQIVSDGQQVTYLQTAAGQFSADTYILATGAWTNRVLDNQALSLDIKPIRGQMLLFKFDSPPLKNIVLQNGLYLIPRRDGHLLVGSTLEDVGFDKSTTLAVQHDLLQRAQAVLPALATMPIVKHWAGLRPGSPRNIPAIGRHPTLQNLYVNSGHFRYGVTMAPASVEILLNELNGRAQPFDVSAYRPSLFG